ncbi:molybdopterin-synthase adenylyltransferase MoeB [Robbsia sp. Bb-Pol-6]|uniref:Molybdopterin-synthase adenylyltransferase MoeB n=1 Tax=Robbsia betulipollinis TaxID=2981849 RepID=A0ABT3ZL50_9BURK|nr:molybdopterin-synthase adenylyltransferase MoeB [Robbsia betulipollinis]MCY0387142.1 molybdopterin-synthase adenylyltransferase MoeB [Robbsia betulipollinis]
MNDEQLLRYSRHILLDEWGIEAQRKILDARALIIGAGGLGCPAALYLAAAGLGRMTLVDGDQVDLTNLQRQIAHTMASIDMPKVASLRSGIGRLNPDIRVTAVARHADAALLDTLVADADVVLDCTDHFEIRQQINRACVRHRVPLVSGAALRFDGQVTSFDFRRDDSPCYACIFPPDAIPEEAACATMGVFSPTVGMIGAIQAAEALKLVAGVGGTLTGRLMMLDSLRMTWSEIRVGRQPDCLVCGGRGLPSGSPAALSDQANR